MLSVAGSGFFAEPDLNGGFCTTVATISFCFSLFSFISAAIMSGAFLIPILDDELHPQDTVHAFGRLFILPAKKGAAVRRSGEAKKWGESAHPARRPLCVSTVYATARSCARWYVPKEARAAREVSSVMSSAALRVVEARVTERAGSIRETAVG